MQEAYVVLLEEGAFAGVFSTLEKAYEKITRLYHKDEDTLAVVYIGSIDEDIDPWSVDGGRKS